MRTVGKGGQSLLEYFETRGGPEGYLGTTFPGFPNFFTILGSCAIQMVQTNLISLQFPGPNVITGHASAIFSEEQQVRTGVSVSFLMFGII
jgi:hypothetical protein